MQRYDDPVEVRRGPTGEGLADSGGPEQFLWRGRLWKVRAVVAHWVEARREREVWREVWRVEAGRGGGVLEAGSGAHVFDLSCDGARGDWRLARAVD